MSGSLTQLAAKGPQDAYLSVQAQITFFKSLFRRHTDFAIETVENTLDNAKPGLTQTLEVIRQADLMSKCTLRVELPELIPTNTAYNGNVAWVRRLGHAILDSIEIVIGGTSIDKHYGTFLDVWYELTHNDEQERGYKELIGDVEELTTPAVSVVGGRNVYVPLQFWFARNYGYALPLIALQYHTVRFNIVFQTMANLVCATRGTGTVPAPVFNQLAYNSAALQIQYIYLGADERTKFAQMGHEYLINQIQIQEANLQTGATSQSVLLGFNHPCLELIWINQSGAWNGADQDAMFLAYSNTGAWDAKLDTAAGLVARSMIAGAVPDGTAEATAKTTLSINADASVQSVTVQSDDSVVSAVVGSTHFVFTIVTAPSATADLYIITNPLGTSSYNLASKLGSVTAHLKFSGTAVSEISHVSADDHTVDLYDLSTPISKYTLDYRASGTNATDVHIVMPSNYGVRIDGKGNIVNDGQLLFNGNARFQTYSGEIFNYKISLEHHTHTPADGVNIYCFSLFPEQQQPSGTANLSRIDKVTFNFKVSDVLNANRSVPFDIYANTRTFFFCRNYNILRFAGGMCGLAYTN